MNLLTPTAAPQRSLAIPKRAPPDDYRAYVEHPEVATLNQIMLHYLEMEEILKLYRQNHEQFETQQALTTLAQRFKLPAATTFKQLLRDYDMKYATVRSYLYNNRTPEQILLQAASEGNIQAFYNQLKLYPELREQIVYFLALRCAARGGHEAIMELLFELGAKDVDATVLINAAKGGQLAIVQKELAKEFEPICIEDAVHYAAEYRHKAVLAALFDYSTDTEILRSAMEGAGEGGDTDIIEYVISRGGKDYTNLIERAARCDHFDIVRKYWDKLTVNDVFFNDDILRNAVVYGVLDMVKFLVESKLISRCMLGYRLSSLRRSREKLLEDRQLTHVPYELKRIAKQIAVRDSIIAYLESEGVVDV